MTATAFVAQPSAAPARAPVLFRAEPPAGAPAPLQSPGAGLALALHAALLSQPTTAAAAQALVVTLARQLQLGLVWAVWCKGPQLHLLARSDGTPITHNPASDTDQEVMLAAAAESFDQSATVAWPPSGDGPAQGAVLNADPPRVARAHKQLVRLLGSAPSQTAQTPHAPSAPPSPVAPGEPVSAQAFQDTLPSNWDDAPTPPTAAGSAASLPLVVDGQRVGVLGLYRHQGGAFGTAELRQLEHLAGLAAPLLWLMKQNERSSLQRTRDAWCQRWASAGRWRKQQLQALLVVLTAGAVVALLMPWPAQVGGHARLEGAVQRVLAAPADGFVQQVHARAGDSVRAGQPLLELADQDLQLERQRWQSQLSQHLDALATAQARADRTQLVLQQSRADEAQSQLALTEERLQRARLLAPFDAVVVQGDWSQQLGTPVKEGAELLTLAPLDRYRVIVEIDERDIGTLRSAVPGASRGPGAGADAPGAPGAPGVAGASSTSSTSGTTGTLALTALPWDTLSLRVTRVSPLAKPVEGRNVFEVEAELLDTPAAIRAGLRPGLQGTARLDAGHTSPLLHLLRRGLGSARVAWWEWWG